MRGGGLILVLLFSISASAQRRPIEKRWIVTSNLLSLIAQRPVFSVEKILHKQLSAEVSYAWGEFNHIFLTDKYTYSGLQVRVKKYINAIRPDRIDPFVAVYAGNLKRTIVSSGSDLFSGWYNYAGRNFSANSLRAGFSTGFTYFSKTNFTLSTQMSLGYGRYTKVYTSGGHPGGYPDVQLSLAVGYCF